MPELPQPEPCSCPAVVVELSDGAQPAIKPTKPNNAIKVYSRFIVQVSFA